MSVAWSLQSQMHQIVSACPKTTLCFSLLCCVPFEVGLYQWASLTPVFLLALANGAKWWEITEQQESVVGYFRPTSFHATAFRVGYVTLWCFVCSSEQWDFGLILAQNSDMRASTSSLKESTL